MPGTEVPVVKSSLTSVTKEMAVKGPESAWTEGGIDKLEVVKITGKVIVGQSNDSWVYNLNKGDIYHRQNSDYYVYYGEGLDKVWIPPAGSWYKLPPK